MSTPLYIYGAGGLGREVLSMVNTLGTFEVKGFIDDQVTKGTVIKGVSVIGGLEAVQSFGHSINLILAIGDPVTKKALASKLTHVDIKYPVLKHPSVILQDIASCLIGEGCILAAGSIFTTDIQLGKHVLINLGCTVGHDTKIGDHCSIMPGVNLAGEIQIGNAVLIGSGTNVLNGIKIGDSCKVGMGAVVIRDVEPGITVAGVPAKRISK